MKHLNQLLEVKVPSSLNKCQKWFASILEMPIDQDSSMSKLSPCGDSMKEEAFDYIMPSPYLQPYERIEIYNQQYWWRLYSIMQETVPLLTRLFGYTAFNEIIAKPYLLKYQPENWSLNQLADRLPQWVQEDYHAKDKQLILDAAIIDIALNTAFFAKKYPSIDSQEHLGELLSKKLFLQPHVFLFNFRYDFFRFRETMVDKEVEYWEENDFPKLEQDRPFYMLLNRNRHNNLKWEAITAGAYQFLLLFKDGSTIDEACDWLESQPAVYEEATSKLHLWFQEWIAKELFYIVD